MSRRIEIPKIDANVTRATLVQWLVREGDRVSPGMPLAEVETEKAVFTIDAECAGVVGRILVPAGEKLPVGTLIGVIAEAGEVIAEMPSSGIVAPTPAAQPAAPFEVDAEYEIDYREALLE